MRAAWLVVALVTLSATAAAREDRVVMEDGKDDVHLLTLMFGPRCTAPAADILAVTVYPGDMVRVRMQVEDIHDGSASCLGIPQPTSGYSWHVGLVPLRGGVVEMSMDRWTGTPGYASCIKVFTSAGESECIGTATVHDDGFEWTFPASGEVCVAPNPGQSCEIDDYDLRGSNMDIRAEGYVRFLDAAGIGLNGSGGTDFAMGARVWL